MLFQMLLKSVVRKRSLTLLTVSGKSYVFGDGTPPSVVVKLHRRSLEWTLALNPDLKIGEAFVEGSLTIEQGDIYDFIYLVLSNYKETGDRSFFHWREHLYRYLFWVAQYNPLARTRRNITFHYDMPDDLYACFLDSDRQYSCAYFRDIADSLEDAQLDKKRHIASKLKLDRSELSILDIGSGWGGMGLYLAQETGAHVSGVTLSVNQHKISNERAAFAGLAPQCSFSLRDYREEKGPYDRVVSVGMFEHVGKKNYDEFFEHLRDLMSDDGVALVHTIGRYGAPRPINMFMKKYIFPGADLPTMSEVLTAVDRAGLITCDVELLRLHYAETLRRWMLQLQKHRAEISEKYGAEFYKKWVFYFACCEAGFRVGNLMVMQLQLTKELRTLPLTRDYMVDWERAHGAATDELDRNIEAIAEASAAQRRA